jgi:Protein of unknown function (DUF2934)
MRGMEMNRDEEIRELAYRIWQEEGCRDGCEVEHWLRAKMIWEEINHPQSKPKQSKALNKRKSRKISAAEPEL